MPGGATISRSEIDAYTEYLRGLGAKGLAWIKVNELGKGAEGLQSPIVKFFPLPVMEEVLSRTKAKAGDIIFFGADKAEACNAHLGALRQKVGHDRGLAEKGWRPLWVVDFPMFEYDEESKEWKARHHPFTSPKDGHEAFIETDQAKAYAKAYDMVLNGWEIAGGSVRIHREEIQQKVFNSLKITKAEQQAKFGFLLQALQYGAPPHGGIAFGFDRLVTLMAGAEAIRDVIAFPKTQRGQDLVTGAPSPVTERQLRELHIRLRNTDAAVRLLAGLLALVFSFSAFCFSEGEIEKKQLPKEALETIALIRKGGPFPHQRDGVVFGNREKLLPRARARLVPRVHGADAGRKDARRAPHRRGPRWYALLHRRPLPQLQAHLWSTEHVSKLLQRLSDASRSGVYRTSRTRRNPATPRAAARCRSRASISPARPPRRR